MSNKTETLYCRYCTNKVDTNRTFLYDNQLYIYCPNCQCFLSAPNLMKTQNKYA